MRGDWSDTGPDSRPESEISENDVTSNSALRRMSNIMANIIDRRLQYRQSDRDDSHTLFDSESESSSDESMDDSDNSYEDNDDEEEETFTDTRTSSNSINENAAVQSPVSVVISQAEDSANEGNNVDDSSLDRNVGNASAMEIRSDDLDHDANPCPHTSVSGINSQSSMRFSNNRGIRFSHRIDSLNLSSSSRASSDDSTSSEWGNRANSAAKRIQRFFKSLRKIKDDKASRPSALMVYRGHRNSRTMVLPMLTELF